MNRRTFISTAALTCVAGCSNTTRDSNRSRTEPNGSSVDAAPTGSAIDPTAQTVGDTYTHPSGMAVTLVSARITGKLRLKDRVPLRIGVSETFLVAKVQASNTSDSPVDFPSIDSFSLIIDEPESGPRDLGKPYQSSITIDFPVTGQSYSGATDVPPGGSVAGWLVFDVPSSFQEYRLSLSDPASETAMTSWRGRVDQGAAPELEVTSVDVPDEHPAGDPIDIEISIENTGGSAGLYNERYFIRRGDSGRTRGRYLQTIVHPGETVTITESTEVHTPKEITISVPGYRAQTVTVVSNE